MGTNMHEKTEQQAKHLDSDRSGEFEYVSSAQKLCINSTHAAALLDGRVQLHRVRACLYCP